jgi:agmatinase
MLSLSPFIITISFTLTLARDIIFPPMSGVHPFRQQNIHQDPDNTDTLTSGRFRGLTTFANLPYVDCFLEDGMESYDIAILGAPFDTVSSFR